jgi:predicted hotdog family 3-hydroxylacyl-ACP dehydratase
MKDSTKIADKNFVQSLLPQRAPLVLIDALYDYSETSLVSGFTIQSDTLFLKKGVFSETGIIEHLAQSVALHTGYQFYLKNEAVPTGYIGAIKNIEIKNCPKLDDEIRTTVSILHEFGGITLVDVVAKVKNIEIAKGQMKTVLAQ